MSKLEFARVIDLSLAKSKTVIIEFDEVTGSFPPKFVWTLCLSPIRSTG